MPNPSWWTGANRKVRPVIWRFSPMTGWEVSFTPDLSCCYGVNVHFGNQDKILHPGLGSDTYRGKCKCLDCGMWTGHGQWIVNRRCVCLISIPGMGHTTINPDIAFLPGDSCFRIPEDLYLLRKYSLHGLQACSRIAVAADVWDEEAYFQGTLPSLRAPGQLLFPSHYSPCLTLTKLSPEWKCSRHTSSKTRWGQQELLHPTGTYPLTKWDHK